MPSALNSLTPKDPNRLDSFPSLPVNNGKCANEGTSPPKASNI